MRPLLESDQIKSFHLARERLNKLHPQVLTAPAGALKIKEAARYLGVSPISVRRLIHRGLIKPNRALRHILIPIGELDRFLEEGQR
jgi:excisionase family DNA binding protein